MVALAIVAAVAFPAMAVMRISVRVSAAAHTCAETSVAAFPALYDAASRVALGDAPDPVRVLARPVPLEIRVIDDGAAVEVEADPRSSLPVLHLVAAPSMP